MKSEAGHLKVATAKLDTKFETDSVCLFIRKWEEITKTSPHQSVFYLKSTLFNLSDPVGCGVKFTKSALPARSGVECASGTHGASAEINS